MKVEMRPAYEWTCDECGYPEQVTCNHCGTTFKTKHYSEEDFDGESTPDEI